MLAIGAEIGGYRIDRVLGRGGMGVVYEATQLSLGRVVALKVLPADLSHDESFRERFRREGRTQASVDHPHIVTVHEAGEDEAGFYIAMRLIRGSNLKQTIAESGGLEPERALRLLGQVADALDSAHAAGLIHRDVKPHNVLVDERDYAYLADFGLAMIPGLTALTRSGEFVGTLDYVSPEQVRGEPATAASDVYALAAVTYEALTGDVPFTRESKVALMFAHLTDPPPAVSERASGFPVVLDRVLQAGMAKDPRDRPASATALVDAVSDALGIAPPPRRVPARAVAAAETVIDAPTPKPRAPTGGPPPAAAGSRPRWILPTVALAGVAVVVAVALLASGGGGAGGGADGEPSGTVVGSDPSSTRGEPSGCTGGSERAACTIVQTALPGRTAAVPADGTITRWSVRGADGTLALAVLRGRRTRTLVGLSDLERISGSGIHSFRTRIEVRQGDLIGLQVQQGSRFGTISYHAGARLVRFIPPLALGDSAAGEPTASDIALLVSADVERR